jgi:hypothetical protein
LWKGGAICDLEVRETVHGSSQTSIKELIMAAAIAIGITSLGVGVANLVNARVTDDEGKRSAFTQQFVQQASQQYPTYNVVICHNPCEAKGLNVIHQHQELPMTLGTCGYDIYFSPKGKPFSFVNLGDGGFINWAFEGEFNRPGNGNVLEAVQHS